MTTLTGTPGRPRALGRRRRPPALAVLAACAALAAGCSSGSSTGTTGAQPDALAGPRGGTIAGDETPPQDGGSLVVGIDSDSSGWNNGIDRWGTPGALVGSSVLEPLAMLDKDGVAQPWLADSWTHDADYTSWTIKVHPGITFQDGEAFDAAALKKNLDAVQSEPLTGVAVQGVMKGSEVVDPSTVRIDLLQPWAAFPSSWMANQSSMQRAPAMLDAPDAGRSHPIGTGPFTFVEWKPDNYFRTEKNTHYWRRGEPHLDKLEFRVITDDLARLHAVQNKDIDVMLTTFAFDDQATGDEVGIHDWGSEPTMLMANNRDKVVDRFNPLSNIHARKAVAYATDTQSIAALVGDGVTVPDSPFGPASPWYDPAQGSTYPHFDLQRAKDEVAAYEKDTGQPSLNVAVVALPDVTTAKVFQAIQAQWQQAGISMTIEQLDAAALIQRLIAGNFELIEANIYSSPDPDDDYYFWSAATNRPPGQLSINFAGFSNDVTEAAIKKGRQTEDPRVRRDAYTSIIQELNRNALNIWLYWTPYTIWATKTVRGLQTPSQVPFANFGPKTWWGEVWRG
jgi:peptide/nickel transport system substrate-binding protein